MSSAFELTEVLFVEYILRKDSLATDFLSGDSAATRAVSRGSESLSSPLVMSNVASISS